MSTATPTHTTKQLFIRENIDI